MPTRTSLTTQEFEQVLEMIDLFIAEQLSPWQNTKHCDLLHVNGDYIQQSPTIYLFEFDQSGVRLIEKERPFLREGTVDPFALRAKAYCGMFEEALSGQFLNRPISIAVDTGDETPEATGFPLFAFQKPKGSRNILMPDIDLILNNCFREAPNDVIPFLDKLCRASFAGSTTGAGLIDAEKLQTNRVPRIRAGRFFKGKPDVDFRLTSIVQCASLDIEQALRREGFGGAWIDWNETYQSKFGISIDGNGAACSRPAVLLLSNCVPIKYESPNILYYFQALEEGKHYLNVNSDQEVLEVVEQERQTPGQFASIAAKGRSLSEILLSKEAVHAYASRLLHAFACLG